MLHGIVCFYSGIWKCTELNWLPVQFNSKDIKLRHYTGTVNWLLGRKQFSHNLIVYFHTHLFNSISSDSPVFPVPSVTSPHVTFSSSSKHTSLKHSSHRSNMPIDQNISYLHIYAALCQFLHKIGQPFLPVTNKIWPTFELCTLCQSLLQFSRQTQKNQTFAKVVGVAFILFHFKYHQHHFRLHLFTLSSENKSCL